MDTSATPTPSAIPPATIRVPCATTIRRPVRFAVFVEPRVSLGFPDDGEDLDRFFRDAIELHLEDGHAVRRDQRVAGRDGKTMLPGLGHEQSIERISVMPREPRGRPCLGGGDRELEKSGRCGCGNPVVRKHEFALRRLQLQLPRTRGAEENGASRILNHRRRLGPQAGRIVQRPEQRVRIQQEVHSRSRSATRRPAQGSRSVP